MLSLRRWRPVHLLLGWIGYWAGLALVTFGPAIPAILRATAPEGQGSISAGMSDGVARVTISSAGTTLWSGAASGSQIALAIVGPPLLLWGAWLLARRRQRESQLRESEALRELPLPDAGGVAAERHSRGPAERVREDA